MLLDHATRPHYHPWKTQFQMEIRIDFVLLLRSSLSLPRLSSVCFGRVQRASQIASLKVIKYTGEPFTNERRTSRRGWTKKRLDKVASSFRRWWIPRRLQCKSVYFRLRPLTIFPQSLTIGGPSVEVGFLLNSYYLTNTGFKFREESSGKEDAAKDDATMRSCNFVRKKKKKERKITIHSVSF